MATDERPRSDSADRDLPSPLADALLRLARLRMRAVIARLELPIDALRAVRPGQVLASPGPVHHRVELVVGDAPCFAGELVDLDGRLAVRIDRVID